jgi:hypothetical protein
MRRQEREHAALSDQMTDKRFRVQKIPVHNLYALAPPDSPDQANARSGEHADYSAPS